jgi:hypothetical protein
LKTVPSSPRSSNRGHDARFSRRFQYGVTGRIRLVIETRIEAYECDASAIEGIWASKSSEESFASVDEFGEDFCRYKGWGLDMASLKLACRHDQVRIFNSPGIDVFEARAWDGRFFIGNAGGSHHLAAAIHLATRLGVPLPARERLVLFRLNEKTVSWALENFHLIVVPTNSHFEALSSARVLAGVATSLELPDRLGSGRLIVFPRSSTLAQRLATELLSKGYQDAGAALQIALQRQKHFLTCSKLPW